MLTFCITVLPNQHGNLSRALSFLLFLSCPDCPHRSIFLFHVILFHISLLYISSSFSAIPPLSLFLMLVLLLVVISWLLLVYGMATELNYEGLCHCSNWHAVLCIFQIQRLDPLISHLPLWVTDAFVHSHNIVRNKQVIGCFCRKIFSLWRNWNLTVKKTEKGWRIKKIYLELKQLLNPFKRQMNGCNLLVQARNNKNRGSKLYSSSNQHSKTTHLSTCTQKHPFLITLVSRFHVFEHGHSLVERHICEISSNLVDSISPLLFCLISCRPPAFFSYKDIQKEV